ncbi:MAG: enoyl-CoA hydratase/isomerase family protein [Deltaproteobacteria bacterium]|nr:enoyl-CoA hydratase/isomerase family protein [Deltaproteobacteria bacterium]
MTEYREILCSPGRITRLTLNRPDKRNPIGPVTLGELVHALEVARDDASVRVIIITGAGNFFSAGGDLAQMAGAPGSGPAAAPRPATFRELNVLLTQLGKPTIAMVNGPAIAGGLGVMVACDLAIAADDATFATPEINVGLWPMMIMANIFRNVPRKQAMELIMTGDKVDAATALRIGLVTRVVPRAELEAATTALAEKLADKAPTTMRLGLTAFYETQDLPITEQLTRLEAGLMQVLGTDDAREGISAFVQKRKPSWTQPK